MKNVKKLAIMTLAIMLVGILSTSGVSSIACKKQPQYPLLSITAPSTVYEYQTFMVRVTSLNNPVAGAKVTITASGQTYFTSYTDSNGYVCACISGIDQTKNMTITATKTGYLPGTAWLVVYDVPQLVIQAPSSVYENQQFMVRITANNQPVVGADVVFNDIIEQTNLNGTVNFIAPEVNMTHNFLITACKYGYLNATASILVVNIPQYPQLVISAPLSVLENQEFTVHIFANNQSVPGVSVIFSAFNMTKLTNSNGTVNFWAPEVNVNTVFSINAFKNGYLSATASITVINIPNPPARQSK